MDTGARESAECAKEDAPRLRTGPECGIQFDRDPCVRPLDHEKHSTATGWTWFANRPNEANEAIARLEKAKDGAYAERNQALALLARMAVVAGWRVGVGLHPEQDTAWEPDWRTILFVDLPTGQACWHFHDSERHLLAGLPSYPGTWDGHTTDAKYERVRTALAT